MDSQSLHLSIDFVGSSGVILSPEQKAALQTSLIILKNDQKFAQVKFWGKILGVSDDYYIAKGSSTNQFAEQRIFYSKDCFRWGLLNPPTEEALKKSRLISGRFMGDPSYECEQKIMRKTGGENEEEFEEETITLKEEDRLSAVINDIDREVIIVPRTAFVRTPTGEIRQNRNFEGLCVNEAGKLSNYLHFRKSSNKTGKTMLQRANIDKSIDFMDCIEDDIPAGSWSLQFERGSGLVTLRSLLWLGYIFYHVPGTREYGSVYVGTGEKNIDLPFML